MTMTEPMTLITDWLLAIVVFWFALRLVLLGRERGEWAVRLWAGSFFAAATAAAAGGAWHGFHLHLAPLAAFFLWKMTLFALGAASLFLFASAAFATLRGSARRALLALALVKTLLYAGWMAGHDDYRFVIYDYGSAMVAVLLLQLPGLFRRLPAARWIAAGILLSFAAAAVQAMRLAPHPHFNHNDLYHVIQLGAFWLLYRGGRELRDRAVHTST